MFQVASSGGGGGGGSNIGGWKELGRSTLTSSGDTMEVTGLANKRYLMLLSHRIADGLMEINTRFNSDSGNNYSHRFAQDGATSDATGVNRNFMMNHVGWNTTEFNVAYVANLAGKEKLLIGNTIADRGGGAGTANSRNESVAKWNNVSDAIDEVNMNNTASGSLATGSELVVLGYDSDDTHTDNFWTELASEELTSTADNLSTGTISAKRYLWVQAWIKPSGTINVNMTVNNDNGANYAQRHNVNGTGETTLSSRNYWDIAGTETNPFFANMFIINYSTQEKLCMYNTVEIGTAGAGNAPDRAEYVTKWSCEPCQITEIDLDNIGTGSMDSGSIIKVWGSD